MGFVWLEDSHSDMNPPLLSPSTIQGSSRAGKSKELPGLRFSQSWRAACRRTDAMGRGMNSQHRGPVDLANGEELGDNSEREQQSLGSWEAREDKARAGPG